jgi:2-iminobutanoate/2-iminopropanoate deaminase
MKQRERQWQPVQASGVAAPAGAYSPAVRAGVFVFVSGQVPRDPATGKMLDGDVTAQSKQVLANLERALQSAGAELSDVVSVTVYLATIDDWGAFNEVYKATLTPPYPTRTVVGAELHGMLVEVSAIAYLGNAGQEA